MTWWSCHPSPGLPIQGFLSYIKLHSQGSVPGGWEQVPSHPGFLGLTLTPSQGQMASPVISVGRWVIGKDLVAQQSTSITFKIKFLFLTVPREALWGLWASCKIDAVRGLYHKPCNFSVSLWLKWLHRMGPKQFVLKFKFLMKAHKISSSVRQGKLLHCGTRKTHGCILSFKCLCQEVLCWFFSHSDLHNLDIWSILCDLEEITRKLETNYIILKAASWFFKSQKALNLQTF